MNTPTKTLALWLALTPLLCEPQLHAADPPPPAKGAIRIATYNVAMYRDRAGQLSEELASGDSAQAKQIAEVIQRVRPHALLLCEIDFDPKATAPRWFANEYLTQPQAPGLEGVTYEHLFTAPVNTGEPTGLDLNSDGSTNGPNDCYGYGRYPGQYGMAVLSRLPIDLKASRTFQQLLWSQLPDARRPIVPSTGAPYYSDAIWPKLRLPSKSLFDVVLTLPGGQPLHLVCSHPTPPVFDGPEDSNGCRNADEVRLVTEYLAGALPDYFVDDSGRRGSIAPGEPLVVLGDLNADPTDGNGIRSAINDLIASPRLAPDPAPRSRGALEASHAHPQLNSPHQGDPSLDTGDFGPDGHANLRIDYALPSADLRVLASGVYWPAPGEPGAEAVTASDHRMVWVDVSIGD